MSDAMHNWIAYCAICGKRELKRDLDRLMVRTASGNISPFILAYIHRDCMPALADFLEVEIPDYTVLHHRTPHPRAALPELSHEDAEDAWLWNRRKS